MSCIRLISIKYAERLGQPKEWSMDLPLAQINLLVGKNATGKSRSLNVIAGLSKLLTATPKLMVNQASYEAQFDDDGVMLRYLVDIEGGLVIKEQYFIGEKRVLFRDFSVNGMVGEIEMHLTGQRPEMVRFSPPRNELAVVVRRDSIQHPYLERLHEWAQATRHYTFGTQLGKDVLAIITKDGPEADDRDINQVIGIFRKGVKEFKDDFIEAVKQDMVKLQYAIDSIELVSPENIKLQQAGILTELSCIGVKEEGLDRVIDQTEMSQGMFRALSVLIQVNYSQMSHRASCILIDDIGEGLDFERSTLLIDVLRKKAADSAFQLIMTTNDRFVMNNVPLKEWLVLQRQGGNVRVRNYGNSKKLFDDFKFTGLSNFSFLEMDFLNDHESVETGV